MSPAPPGSLVSIYYDARVDVQSGDAIVTTTGRTYLVASARRQQRGKHRGRWHLRCVVADGPPPADVLVHPLRWYPRVARAMRRKWP
jgi:hypothetical protein